MEAISTEPKSPPDQSQAKPDESYISTVMNGLSRGEMKSPGEPLDITAVPVEPITTPPVTEPVQKPDTEKTGNTQPEQPQESSPPVSDKKTDNPFASEPVPVAENQVPATQELKPQNAAQWAELKQKHADEMGRKEAEIKRHLEESGKFESLKAQNEKLTQQIELLDIRQSPKFQEEFVKPIEKIVERAGNYFDTKEAEEISVLLQQPISAERDSKLEGLLENMTDLKRGRLSRLVAEADTVHENMATVLSDSDRAKQDYIQNQAGNAKHQMDVLTGAFERVRRQIGDGESGLPGFRATDEGFEENLKTMKDYAFGDYSPEESIQLAGWAVYGQKARKREHLLIAKIGQMENEIASMKSAEPSVSGGGAGGANTSQNADLGYAEAVTKGLGRLGLR